ncbi:MAG: CocE/NonD family hydrolase [Candidatus Nanopelagicales bacterium]
MTLPPDEPFLPEGPEGSEAPATLTPEELEAAELAELEAQIAALDAAEAAEAAEASAAAGVEPVAQEPGDAGAAEAPAVAAPSAYDGPILEGTKVDAWIPMSDGVFLAVTLYLPHESAGPQPCILEALPYRKDDMTSSYRPEYVRLRDEYRYAVARLDLRGTGSSGGRATDEYPAQEQRDLAEVLAWLASQPWCDGNLGMYGTSYSGFNSLQMACERPPELKAVIAIYATDDRHTDDVHYMGGLRKWIDLVDYCHYMTPMNALPPVPGVFGPTWRDEWRARIEEHEPWLLTWLAHQRRDSYWQHGSVRPDYDRIECPVMIIAGWADGYRNNTFRTMEKLGEAGVPRRLLAGPWSHAATSSSLPGPRIDSVPEMVRWWDRWLRGVDNGVDAEPTAVWYAQHSHRPEPDLDVVPGVWRADTWPSPRTTWVEHALVGQLPYAVKPDVGTAAWISCAGHLPYGQPLDQRHDDADSLTWDFDPDGLEIAGNPLVELSLSSSAPVATVSAKLTDVAADGTSTLVTRGTLNLTRRGGMDTAAPLEPREVYDVLVELEATAWQWRPGHVLRLSVAGADWPNTSAPPEPVTLSVRGGRLLLPAYEAEGSFPPPEFVPGDPTSSESDHGVVWRVERDVLGRRTACVVDHGSAYDAPYGSVVEHYKGRVSVSTRTFEQMATADVSFTLRFADDGTGEPAAAKARSVLEVHAGPKTYDVTITLVCSEGDTVVGERRWEQSFPRDLA